MMHSLNDYLEMLRDRRRVTAHQQAIVSTVKPGDYVIELGAGPGYFSVLAALAGAARVDAVDLHPMVHLAPRLAEANGVGGIVQAHQCDATGFDPGERAQVIVGDLRGASPFFGRSVDVIISARRRLLDPEGGRLIAQCDRLYCAPCREPKGFADRVTRLNVPGVGLGPITEVAYHTPVRCDIQPGDLLAVEQRWGVLDYRTIDRADFSGQAAWTMGDGGRMEGIALWFESDLTSDVRFSAHPAEPSSVYGQLFLPLRPALVLEVGDHLDVTIRAIPAGDEYVWEWSARRSGASGTETIAQNSLPARIIDPRALKPLC